VLLSWDLGLDSTVNFDLYSFVATVATDEQVTTLQPLMLRITGVSSRDPPRVGPSALPPDELGSTGKVFAAGGRRLHHQKLADKTLYLRRCDPRSLQLVLSMQSFCLSER
jgi:hypothetical protein